MLSGREIRHREIVMKKNRREVVAVYFAYGETELSYLRQKDKRLGEVIDRIGQIDRAVDTDLFSSVVHHIIGQQISTKIWPFNGACAWSTITAASTAGCLKNTAAAFIPIAAWQVCICGRWQAEQYQR